MKMMKIFLAVGLAILSFASCSESWLFREPNGSTLTNEQYYDLGGTTIEGHVSGLYTILLFPGDADQFGQKTVDIVCDLLSSDMAITTRSYGWFETDATMVVWQSSMGRNSYFWQYYYYLIKNCNVLIERIKSTEEFADGNDSYKNYYAQALTMRAYAYYNLMSLYGPSFQQMGSNKDEMAQRSLVPYYNEVSRVDSAVGLSSVADVFGYAESDLRQAIAYFDESGNIARDIKSRVNIDVAKGLLAKLLLEGGEFEDAYMTAKDFIDEGNYTIIPKDELLYNGFNDVSDESWIWGVMVDVNNRGGLRSFQGHVDVHSYSYAYSGGYKAIDQLLYDAIPAEDLRKGWFSNEHTGQLTPDYKFYAANKREAYDANSIDRDWTSDDVLLRIEEIYLVGAEAATRANKLPEARELLGYLIDQRYSNAEDKKAEVGAMSQTELLDEIYYQWRVELWGEGRSLAVFKRFQPQGTKDRGSNHFSKDQYKTASPVIFQLPLVETQYNPNLQDYYGEE